MRIKLFDWAIGIGLTAIIPVPKSNNLAFFVGFNQRVYMQLTINITLLSIANMLNISFYNT